MEISSTISGIALTLSVISLGFTIYNIIRDKGRLRVWSEVYYDGSKNPDNPPPSLKISIVNAGRRPIVLTSLIKKNSSKTWQSPITSPNLPTDDNGYLKRLPAMKDFSAQNTCLVLQEGGIFELTIEHDKHFDLINILEDECYYADKLYIQDVLKRKYYVKSSKVNIKKLIEFKS